jgi:hypothetical protein
MTFPEVSFRGVKTFFVEFIFIPALSSAPMAWYSIVPTTSGTTTGFAALAGGSAGAPPVTVIVTASSASFFPSGPNPRAMIW